MSEIKDGGPAFPSEVWDAKGVLQHETGMTLRDYFAARALQVAWEAYDKGHTTYDAEDVTSSIAEHAYQLADAMLRAREAA